MSQNKSIELVVKCPILGFEETTRMEFSPVDELFFKLKSLDGKDFSFIVVDPQTIRPDYGFEIPAYCKESLELNADSKKHIFIIVAVHNNIHESTLNFLAPIMVNWDNSSLAQVILDPAVYPNYSQADKISNYVEKEEK